MEITPSLGLFIFIPIITGKSLRFLNPEHLLYVAMHSYAGTFMGIILVS